MLRRHSLPTTMAGAAADTAPSLWRGLAFGAAAALVATAVALPLELFLHNANLTLLYVLAVIITGLRYGTRAAFAASVVAFMCFNFFLTEPRYTFHVVRRDELATLIFLALIAAICGPVASQIRRQFSQLREANRYSEAMGKLGQELSVAEDAKATWLAIARVMGSTLQTECCVAAKTVDGRLELYPPPATPIPPGLLDRIEAASAQPAAGLAYSPWAVMPIRKGDTAIAHALIHTDQDAQNMEPHHRLVIDAVLQQAADTWSRIALVTELEAARMATEIEQLRSALLSSVSHDLKSPLSAMMGAAESLRMLDRQLDPQDRQELIDTIWQESHRLDSYIQNLLDMTRLGYGTLTIERDWVSLEDIVGNALARLKRYHPQVQTEYYGDTPAPVIYVHAALIEQALFNILENAGKFSPAGEKVDVIVKSRQNRCFIEIADLGPGIAEPLREQIFDMFYAAADGDQKRQSTGMGLAICRGMITAHGGSVRAIANSPAPGTRFIVELPVDAPADLEPNGHADREA